MNQPCIDKNLLNLLSIFIAGAGIFAIFLKYDVPQLNYSFYDENLFGVKRDKIEKTLTIIFVILTSIGLLVQIYTIINGHKIQESIYETSYYIKFTIIGIIGMTILVIFLGFVGKCIAKKQWWPIVIEKHTKTFNEYEEIIKNKGLYDHEVEKKFPNQQKEKIISQRYKNIDEIFEQIENLLEIKDSPESREEKYYYLKKYFDQNNS